MKRYTFSIYRIVGEKIASQASNVCRQLVINIFSQASLLHMVKRRPFIDVEPYMYGGGVKSRHGHAVADPCG